MLDGILIVNKPQGMTSHDVVDSVRKALGIRQVGHAGTLDPLATGVLIILVGKCTKLFEHFLKLDKEYVATLRLGAKTTTGDIDGKIIERREILPLSEERVKHILSSYVGETLQVPPMVSALKHKGERLYNLARKGIEVLRQPRKVTIKELRLLKLSPTEIRFYLKCSRGTYVRQLAEDIARDLGCIGFVSQIERQGIGPFNIRDSLAISEIETSRILPFPAA